MDQLVWNAEHGSLCRYHRRAGLSVVELSELSELSERTCCSYGKYRAPQDIRPARNLARMARLIFTMDKQEYIEAYIVNGAYRDLFYETRERLCLRD